MNKFLVSKKNILSEVAHWAVAQSPYHRPDNLEIVLDKLNILLGEWKENLGYREMIFQDYKGNEIGRIPNTKCQMRKLINEQMPDMIHGGHYYSESKWTEWEDIPTISEI